MKSSIQALSASLLIALSAAPPVAADCRVVEFPERYEAVCIGDPRPATGRGGATVVSAAESQAQVGMTGAPRADLAPSAPVWDGSGAPTPQRADRRPRSADLEAARAVRMKLIVEQRQKELDGRPTAAQ